MRKNLLLLLIVVNFLGLNVALADDLASIKEQLSWMKYSSVEEAFAKLSKVEGYDVETNKSRMAELEGILSKDVKSLDLSSAADLATAKKALELQKQILFANPAFEFDQIILGRYKLKNARGANSAQMGTQGNNWSNQTSAKQTGFDGEIGILSNLKGDLKYEQVYKPSWSTSLPDIRLHWDADRVMFSMTPEGQKHWQVYEVGVDGDNFKQLTDGAAEYLDYFDANYLPSGKILAVTNHGNHGVPCVNGGDQVGNIVLIDPATNDVRRLTFDQDANWGPVMMNNGKVMYTRWEYTDLMHYYSRFVMFMNPDGTEQKALFGSGMTFPNTTFDIQPLPDHPSRFVGIVSGHHGVVRAGRLFMYDPAVSRNTTAGMVHEFPYKDREVEIIIKDRLVDGVWPQFIKPFPIDNENILVTAKMSPKGLWGLYVVDVYDNVTLVAEFEGEGLINATPLRKTKTPPVIPDKVDLSNNEATVFIQDIYEGEGLPNVPRGTVKKLRIHTYEYVYNKTYSNHYGLGIQSGWDMKTNLGTVDVEEDGSATFKIPANTPISIQPLDSEGRAIQWMRSWFVGMPGETVSCVGCHEDQNQIPMPKKTIASTRTAHVLEAPKGGIRPFTFDLEVQPVLDRNCVSCHGAGKKLDFTGGKKDDQSYGTSFLALHPFVHRQGAEAALKVMVPYEYHASVSPLVQLLKNGHYGVELTDEEWYSIYNWIDYNTPDIGYHRVDNKAFPYDQYTRRIELGKKYANGVYADWRKMLDDYKAYLASQPAVEPAAVNYSEPKFKKVKVKGYPAEYSAGETRDVEVAPGVTITFVKIPAGSFAMGENRANSNAAPAHKADVKKAFWMSTTEISNAQVRALLPDHSSRFFDQQWKDHVTEGYPANGDDQVALRISWNDANKYCELMSEKIDEKVMLPTETQWEWAARGGVDEDYWYGTNASFATKENLSDKQALKMAVKGVDPQPMANEKTWNGINWYDYCTYIPKDESVDDGNMLGALPGSYEANPFGLYDMIGNVSEWTRSDYYTYDSKATGNSEYKVVKGGSWRTHPKNARVAARWYYYPWQAPFNVGMRLVIED